MLMPIHDPRDSRYRSPHGAVETGSTVIIKIAAPRTFEVRDAVLYCDFLPAETEEDAVRKKIPMEPAPDEAFSDTEGEYDVFRGALSLDGFTGLVFYHFALCKAGEQPYYYGKMSGDSEHPEITGGIYNAAPVPAWQITVYEPQQSPAWFGEGITYGIFPDRFCRSGKTQTDTPLKNWGEKPKYLPDADGIIRRNDFYGGDLEGIRAHLSDLRALGVTTVYLNPIFEAYSNHRYDTGDYERIDSRLGTEDEFRALCRDAHSLGMRILLDGVFSHTGNISRYFNADGRYPELGAAQSKDSPYYAWYRFKHWPDEYLCWWDVLALPCVEETDPEYLDYIVRGENSIVRRWLRAGADGWRLDVADELPDIFLDELRSAAREERPDAMILGEVWEDASNKVAYGNRRRYFLGKQLDGVMNYPLRTCILDYLSGKDAWYFADTMSELQENYPPTAMLSCMNFLGTHDTERILSVLGCQSVPETLAEQEDFHLTEEERKRGIRLECLTSALLYAFPGSPMIFYGDEAGMEGLSDPFNRGCYPWGREDRTLKSWYALLGAARNHSEALKRGKLIFLKADGQLLAFTRETEREIVLICAARDETVKFTCPWQYDTPDSLLSGSRARIDGGKLTCTIPGGSCIWLKTEK